MALRYPIPLASDLADLVRKAVTNNTAGLRDEIAKIVGTAFADPFIKPNADGTWPRQDRTVKRTLWWLRQIDDTTLAPMPTFTDGYLLGDFIFPGETTTDTGGGTTTPTTPPVSTSMLWSDSMVVSTNTTLTTRVGDAFAGGANPSWVADTSKSVTTYGHVHASATLGLDLYSEVYARVTAPALPSTGTWRAKWLITRMDANNAVHLILRGTSYNAASTTRLEIGNKNGGLTATLMSTGAPSVTIGTAPFTAGSSVVTVESTDSTVTVSVDGSTVGTVAVPSTYPRLTDFTMWAPTYLQVGFKNFEVEDL